MQTITLTWDVLLTRKGGKALPKSEIAYTEVFYSADAMKTWTSLAKVAPDATQTVARDIPDGAYVFRFIVNDIFGSVSDPVDLVATVKSPPPSGVTNAKAVVS